MPHFPSILLSYDYWREKNKFICHLYVTIIARNHLPLVPEADAVYVVQYRSCCDCLDFDQPNILRQLLFFLLYCISEKNLLMSSSDACFQSQTLDRPCELAINKVKCM